MAIAKLTVTEDTPLKINKPAARPPTYKTVTIDEKVLPKSQLLAYISGSSWSVDYYQQVLGRSDDIKEYDISQGHIYQQYNKIKNLELRVDGPLDTSFDDDTNMVTITGNALMYPSIIPNIDDVFIATCGDGRKGIFSITSSERKTFNRESVFSISYVCTGFTDIYPDKVKNIEEKVIRNYVFNKDRLINGGVAVLTEEEDNNFVELTEEYHKLVKYYMKLFFEDDISSLSVPGQRPYTYDHFVTEFMLNLIDVEEYDKMLRLRLSSIENDRFLKQPQLYSILLDRDPSLLEDCNKVMRLITTRSFCRDAMLQSLRFSKITLLVYPMDYDVTGVYTQYLFYRKRITCRLREVTDYYNLLKLKMDKSKEEQEELNVYDMFFKKIKPEKVKDDTKLMLEDIEHNRALSNTTVHKVLKDDYYVFTKAFYEDQPGQSLLESLTLDYLYCREINISNLMTIVKECRKWGRLEQFYYMPIVLLLIKATNRNLH